VPLLSCEDLRIDVDGVPSCDGLTLRASHNTHARLLVVGAPRALFLATIGLLPVARGMLCVRGVPAQHAALKRIVAGASSSPPLPPNWTIAEYIEWSARIAGHSSSQARIMAKGAMECLQLAPLSKSRLGGLAPHARRATVIAAAMATGAGVLTLEDPVGDLPEEMAMAWASTLAKALESYSWIVFSPHMPLTSPLTLAAEEALMVSPSSTLVQGPPAHVALAEGRFVARMHGAIDSLAPRLAELGIAMFVDGAHVVVDLCGRSTFELLAACNESGVVVVELRPLSSLSSAPRFCYRPPNVGS
jgi:ABC-2 type transport system ATP-binding protein